MYYRGKQEKFMKSLGNFMEVPKHQWKYNMDFGEIYWKGVNYIQVFQPD